MTVGEYNAIPRGDERTLLLYGRIMVLPRPSARPKHALNNLSVMLDRWIARETEGCLGFGIDMVLDCERALVHAPDLSYISGPHKRRLKNGRLLGPADLCVDIIDETQSRFVMNRRFADYQRYGVPWYWAWHVDRSPAVLEECRLLNGRYECRSEIAGAQWFEPGLFPGLIFRLPQLLEGDLKAAVKGKAKKLM